jgi:hypothetical protein
MAIGHRPPVQSLPQDVDDGAFHQLAEGVDAVEDVDGDRLDPDGELEGHPRSRRPRCDLQADGGEERVVR